AWGSPPSRPPGTQSVRTGVPRNTPPPAEGAGSALPWSPRPPPHRGPYTGCPGSQKWLVLSWYHLSFSFFVGRPLAAPTDGSGVVVAAAADELPQEGVLIHQLRGDGLEVLEGLDELQQLGAAHILLGHRLEKGQGVILHHRHLIGEGGVEDDIRPVLVGGDVQLLPPAHIGPHLQGVLHVGAPEVVVPHRPAGQAHPGA